MKRPAESNQITFAELALLVDVAFDDHRRPMTEALEEALMLCVRRAADYQGTANLTLKLKFEPKDDRMLVGAELTTKTPQPGTLQLAAYVDRFRRLVVDDPRQKKLPLTDINASEDER